jgi:hypothetical protein
MDSKRDVVPGESAWGLSISNRACEAVHSNRSLWTLAGWPKQGAEPFPTDEGIEFERVFGPVEDVEPGGAVGSDGDECVQGDGACLLQSACSAP